jgi:hypothetical protein
MGKADESPEAVSQSLAAVRAGCQNGRNVRLSRVAELILMGKGGDEFARGRIPELAVLFRLPSNPSAVRTKSHVDDSILMGKARR